MKIIFTGGSSFTGMWFIKELVKKGHHIVATFSSSKDSYTNMRLSRIMEFLNYVEPVFECPFGSDRFIRLLGSSRWDLLCHHGAEVENYKDPHFNVSAALANNTRNIYEIMMKFKEGNCHKILLTGSLFENGEGGISNDSPALSPYGLSKGMTSEMFQYYCSINNLKLGKFVISNPFGPYEEKKLSFVLMEAWHKHTIPVIKTPRYIRDNIHVSLLAKVYADFVERLDDKPGFEKIRPAGYIESLANFAERVAGEMRKRLPWECEYEVIEQKEFLEPAIRINSDLADITAMKWNEEQAWNNMAAYYDKLFNG